MKPRDLGCAVSTKVMYANKMVCMGIADGLTHQRVFKGAGNEKGFSRVAKGPREAGIATF